MLTILYIVRWKALGLTSGQSANHGSKDATYSIWERKLGIDGTICDGIRKSYSSS